ncbi:MULTISPECIES: hypothetical protein [unclassified Desulfovibrio]|uniref:hypothetical protein n=1 Tax=unclassified Desulfovibrio TaxID=2593640 RepID=UPI002FD9A051
MRFKQRRFGRGSHHPQGRLQLSQFTGMQQDVRSRGGHSTWEQMSLEHLTLEMLAYGRQKPACSHFVARIFRKILAEQLTRFIRKLL